MFDQWYGRSGFVVTGLLAVGLVACGDGGGQATNTAEDEAGADGASSMALTQELTPEEAEHLAAFRAQRDQEDATATNPGASRTETAEPTPKESEATVSAPGNTPHANAGGTQAAAANATVFREHHITDPGMNNTVASTLLVPEGWAVEGGITRPAPQYYSNPVLLDVKVTAPDGRQAHFFPSMSFEFNTQQPGQLFAPTGDGNMTYPLPETPGQWIMELARRQPDPTVSKLQLVSEEMEPTLTRQLQQQSAPLYQMIQDGKPMAMQTGVDMAFDTQATVITLRYTQNGIDLEESILMTWQYFVNLWQGQVTGGKWGVGLMLSSRGPVGTDYANDPELMAIFHSVRVNPQWQNEMNRYWAELARIRSKGAADRNRDWQAHNAKMQQINNETSDIISRGWSDRQAIRDAGFERSIDAVREVTPYQTPSGETVKLPSFYDNVYTDGNGRYVLTNDRFYNPDGDVNMTGSWQRIEAAR
ncbi:MAG: hypothetical protein AAF333_11060 [Planctomycetota bacterium]